MTPRLLPWILRVGWAVLPLVAGPAFAAALDDRSRRVQVTASVLLWVGWAIVEVATIVLHPIALTVVRVAAPAAVAASASAIAAGSSGAASVVALVTTAALVVVAFLPECALPYVNGPAYPNERRFPLRPPGPLLLGPLPLAWALMTVAPACGLLLLASEQWVLGGLASTVGIASAVILGRSMYTLARRWVVFVPAGVVVHDPMSLADPVLFRRQDVRALGPALATTTAVDLTARAFGLALELEITEPVPLALAKPGTRTPETVSAQALLIAPSRPGAVLAEARERRVG